MLHFKNVMNAFSVIQSEDVNLVLDPWISPGIYDGSWAPYPPVDDGPELLRNATHCFISHIDDDHWDPQAIHLLDKAQIFLPKQFPNHILEQKLRARDLRRIQQVELCRRFAIGGGIELEIVPPMNSTGLEFDMIGNDRESELAVDAGLIVYFGSVRLVLLSDNTPYVPHHAKTSLDSMKGCDLLGFNYNGAASDFPLCYDIDRTEADAIRNRLEAKREKAIVDFIRLIKPKNLLPYSSEFMLMGNNAVRFAEFHEGTLWADKRRIAKHYEKLTGVPAYAMYQQDSLHIDASGELVFELTNQPLPSLTDLAREYYSHEPPHFRVYGRPDPERLCTKLVAAGASLFNRVSRYGLKPRHKLHILIEDMPAESVVFDFDKGVSTRTAETAAPCLCCRISSNYLDAILDRRTNWNSAQLSFQVSWKREPIDFDMDLYRALYFLALPPEASARGTAAPAVPSRV